AALNAEKEAQALRQLKDGENPWLNAMTIGTMRYENIVAAHEIMYEKNTDNPKDRMLMKLAFPIQLGKLGSHLVSSSVATIVDDAQKAIKGRDNSGLPEMIRNFVVPVWFIPIELFVARKPSGHIPPEFRAGTNTDMRM